MIFPLPCDGEESSWLSVSTMLRHPQGPGNQGPHLTATAVSSAHPTDSLWGPQGPGGAHGTQATGGFVS